jgi:hypothetical protein
MRNDPNKWFVDRIKILIGSDFRAALLVDPLLQHFKNLPSTQQRQEHQQATPTGCDTQHCDLHCDHDLAPVLD